MCTTCSCLLVHTSELHPCSVFSVPWTPPAPCMHVLLLGHVITFKVCKCLAVKGAMALMQHVQISPEQRLYGCQLVYEWWAALQATACTRWRSSWRISWRVRSTGAR